MATAIPSRSFAVSPSSRQCPLLRRGNDLIFFNRNRRRPPLRFRASSESRSAAVEVIGIGSRKDAVIDFCLSNPSASSSRLRFWTVHLRDSQKVQLLQRCHGTEMVLRDVEFPLSLQPSPPAVILVASAGFGIDHITAMDLLNSIKSAGGLTVAILLKPFSFEGQRRLDEVDNLVNMLQDHSHLYIVVEADPLLKGEMKTLAEALDSANNAVLLTMNTVSVLMSEVNLKILNTHDGYMKSVKSFEVLQLLEIYGEAKVGFGAGYNLKSAITQAAFDCPFLCGELKDFNGVVLFTLSSACDMDESDFPSAILSFREFTEFAGDIVFSRIHKPNLESNLIVVGLLIFGCKGKQVRQKKSFLSGLALHFPFLFSFFGREFSEPNGNPSSYSHNKPSVDAIFSSDTESTPLHLVNSVPEADIEDKENGHFRGELSHSNKRVGGDLSEVSCEPVSKNMNQTNADADVHIEKDSGSSVGPGFHIAQLWAKERAAFVGSNQIDSPEIFTLPIGVKSSELCSNRGAYPDSMLQKCSIDMSTESMHAANFSSGDALSDTGLEAITEIYNNALTILKGRNMDEPRKRRLLSERAASMLGWFYFHTGDRWFANFWKGKANGEGRFYSNNGCIFFGCFQNGWRHGDGLCIDADGSRWTEIWDEGVLISRTLMEKEADR